MAEAAKEAEALATVLTRLASTPDEALEPLLVRLLPVVISKLALGDATVQQKVLAILSHVNKRIQPLPQLRLPLTELAELYASDASAPMSRNFAAVYLERAGARADPADVATVLTQCFYSLGRLQLTLLIPGLARRQEAHQNILLRLVLWALPFYAHPGTGSQGATAPSRMLEGAEDRALFLSFACQLMSYQPPPLGSTAGAARVVPGTSPWAVALLDGAEALRQGGPRDPLPTAKLGVLSLCCGSGLPPPDLLLLCTLAAADPAAGVAARGEAALRTTGDLAAALEDEGLAALLLRAALGPSGDDGADGPRTAPAPPPAAQLRLLGLLGRSGAAARDVPRSLALVRASLASPQRAQRVAGAELASWVFRHAPHAELARLAPQALAQCLDLVLHGGAAAADPSTRGAALAALSHLVQRVPACMVGRVDVAAALFQALAVEPAGTRALLQETLFAISLAFKDAKGSTGGEILALLRAYISSPQDAARATALQWAIKLFPGDEPETRHLAIVAAADASHAVAHAATDSLAPVPRTREEDAVLPEFEPMLDCLLQHSPALGAVRGPAAHSPMPLKSLEAAIVFMERLRGRLGDAPLPTPDRYLALLAAGLGPDAPTALHRAALAAVLAALAARGVTPGTGTLEALAIRLLPLTGHADGPARELAARGAGALRAHLPAGTVRAWVDVLRGAGAGKKVRLEEGLGAAAAVGCVVAQARLTGEEPEPETLGALLACTLSTELDPELRLACTQALALIAGSGAAAHEPREGGVLGATDWKAVVAAVTPLSQATVPQNVQSLAVATLGMLGWALPDAGVLGSITDALLALHSRRGDALLFSAGEALCLVFGGTGLGPHDLLDGEYTGLAAWSDRGAARGESMELDGGAAPPGLDLERGAQQPRILDALLLQYMCSTRSEQRAAGTAWLAALLQFVGDHPALKARLGAAQDALIPILGDERELMQELASRGLIQVHSLASGSQRETLVKGLIIALTGNAHKRPAASLSGATDAANGTGTAVAGGGPGSSAKSGALLVYKELAGMATALSQPELLYHFMELALQTSGVRSSAGRARPLESLVDGEAGLHANLPRILPRLYRHRFDPNPKAGLWSEACRVQAAMARIWDLLVDDPPVMLAAHFLPVLDSLLADMGTPGWRVRESAALAAAELLRGREWDELRPRFEILWTTALRVLDDVKESVRVTGLSLVRTLRSFTLRATGTESGTPGPEGAAVLAILLPLLLTGLASSAAEVRAVCLECLTTTATQAPPALLRPHIPTLVPAMLEALSGLEDSRLNYVEQHAAGLGVDADRLEGARIVAAQSGPVGDTLDACARVVDEETLRELVPALVGVVRRGVGVATRSGAGTFVSRLVRRLGAGGAEGAAPLLLPLLAAALAERGAEARRTLASAAAAVLRHGAGPARAARALALLLDAGEGGGGGAGPLAAAGVLLVLAREAPERVAQHMAELGPLAYTLQFSGDADLAAAWAAVWEAGTASVGSGVRLLAPEIAARGSSMLGKPGWDAKQAGATALAALAATAPEATRPYAPMALAALLQQLPGRMWEGKESLLTALGPVLAATGQDAELGEGAGPAADAVVQALLVAAGKARAPYRLAALRCLTSVLPALGPGKRGVGARALEALLALVGEVVAPVAGAALGEAGGGDATGARGAVAGQLAECLASAWVAAGCPDAAPTLNALCSLPVGVSQLEAMLGVLHGSRGPVPGVVQQAVLDGLAPGRPAAVVSAAARALDTMLALGSGMATGLDEGEVHMVVAAAIRRAGLGLPTRRHLEAAVVVLEERMGQRER